MEQSRDRNDLPTGELPAIERDSPPRRRFRFTLKLLLFAAVLYLFVIPLIPDFRAALEEIRQVRPGLLLLGLGLEIAALWCYAPLTKAALGDTGADVTRWRLFRIQMSARALSSIVPGGNAAGSTLGYRLLTLSGLSGPDAGFALATVGIGSAVILNLILWTGLVISIPIRGVNPLYGGAALVGVVVMGFAAALVFGLMEGQGRAERVVKFLARRLRVDEARASLVVHQLAERLEALITDRQLLGRVAMWATFNWLLDACALWVFIRAFGIALEPDALIIAFGVANVLAAIPITPGGLGYVDTGYVGMLRGFGVPLRTATLGVASYRFAQFFFPIILGGILYATLRVGPWSIERRDRLIRLRDLAEQETRRGESRIDFQLRFPARDVTGEFIRPRHESWGSQPRRWRRSRPDVFVDGPTRSVPGDDSVSQDHPGGPSDASPDT